MAKNKNEPLPSQNQVVSQLPKQQQPEPTKAPEPEPTKAPEPEPTKAPEPEPTKAPEPEPTKAPEPEPTKAPEPEPTKAPEQSMNAAEKAKAELERRKSESQARAVKKDVISTEPIYRSRTEK